MLKDLGSKDVHQSIVYKNKYYKQYTKIITIKRKTWNSPAEKRDWRIHTLLMQILKPAFIWKRVMYTRMLKIHKMKKAGCKNSQGKIWQQVKLLLVHR